MDNIISKTPSEEGVKSAATSAEKEFDAVHTTIFLALHRLRGWTSEPDLDRQLSNGALDLYGRFLMRGEDVSLSICGTSIECWYECELAPDWHPLRIFIEKWRDEFLAFHDAFARDAEDTLVLVGRWVDFFGLEPSTLVIYVQHLVSEDGVWSAPYTGGLAACDRNLGGSGFRLMLLGKDAKADKATLHRFTRQRVLAENRRLGYAEEHAAEGMFWWSKDLSRADYHSIVTAMSDEDELLEVS